MDWNIVFPCVSCLNSQAEGWSCWEGGEAMKEFQVDFGKQSAGVLKSCVVMVGAKWSRKEWWVLSQPRCYVVMRPCQRVLKGCFLSWSLINEDCVYFPFPQWWDEPTPFPHLCQREAQNQKNLIRAGILTLARFILGSKDSNQWRLPVSLVPQPSFL